MTPVDGSTHCSSRELAAELGDGSFSAVQRIWRKHGLRPPRLQRHLVSNDPDFETKAADVSGLYLNPPAHAAWTRRRPSRRSTVRTAYCPYPPAAPRARLRVQAQRHAQPVRRAEHRHRRGAGPDRPAPHHQVENWFSRILRDVISRGIFTSVKDLNNKRMRDIRQHNKKPKPLKWTYTTRTVDTTNSSDAVD